MKKLILYKEKVLTGGIAEVYVTSNLEFVNEIYNFRHEINKNELFSLISEYFINIDRMDFEAIMEFFKEVV